MRIDPTQPVGRADRVALGRPATMRDPARAPVDVLVQNLSETGALLRTEAQLPVGSLVSLGLAGLGMQIARVVRTPPRAAAIEFMVPLDPVAVERAAAARPGYATIAIPQILVERTPAPGEAAAASPDTAAAPVTRLPVTPLPAAPLPPPVMPAMIGEEATRIAATRAADQAPSTPDARALWQRVVPTGAGAPLGSWLLVGLVLVAAIVVLLL